jgi:hypothetical protein
MHLVRLCILPTVYYKIRQVQLSAVADEEAEQESGQGEGGK